MKSIRSGLSLLLWAFAIGCLPGAALRTAPTAPEEKVLVYLQPLPQETQDLRFLVKGIDAIRKDGTPIALTVTTRELDGAKRSGRQRLIASGRLPPGAYAGLFIRIGEAFKKGEEGESALFVSEEPFPAVHGFGVKRESRSTLFLTLHGSGGITDGIFFRPEFSLASPRRDLTTFIGYVTHPRSDSITIFNKKTMEVMDTFTTGSAPMGIVLDPRLGRAYLAASGDDTIEVIDVLKGGVIEKVSLSFGDEPTDLALSRNGRILVSVNHGSNTVSVIDTVSFYEAWRSEGGDDPTDVVIDPTGLRAYVISPRASTLTVVDLSQKVLSATVSIDGAPHRGAFSRLGEKLFLICRDVPDLLVVDPNTFAVVERIFVGMGTTSIKVDTRSDLVYVGTALGEVHVIDPTSSMFVDTIRSEGAIADMTIDDEENRLFLVFADEARLERVDVTRKKVDAGMEVHDWGHAMVVMGER